MIKSILITNIIFIKINLAQLFIKIKLEEKVKKQAIRNF